jgi:acyl-CoA thioesterase-1
MEEECLSYQIVNKGISGNTTADGLARLDECLAAPLRLLVVALGVNDGLRGVPVAEVKKNLLAIIRRTTAKGVPVLLCRMEALPLYGWPYVEAFRRMYDEIAAETGVRLVPFLLFGVVGNAALMQGDRVHPNAHGAKAMAGIMWPHLRTALAP